MMHGYVLGIDIGTSGAKCVALTVDGRILCSARSWYAADAPNPGWCEQQPEIWWSAVVAIVREVVGDLSRPPEGLAVTGQMHSLVIADETLSPLYPSLLWCDERSAAQAAHLQSAKSLIESYTFNPPRTAYTVSKLLWIRQEMPWLLEEACWLLLPKDWLKARLTGTVVTDPSDASGTGMFDLQRGEWATPILERFGLPTAKLPPVAASTALVGTVCHEAAAAMGMPAGVPVVNGCGDQAAAALAMGLHLSGHTGLILGTSAAIVSLHEYPVRNALAYALPARWMWLDALHAAGGAIEWATRLTGIPFEALDAQLLGVQEAVLFYPYLSGSRDSLGAAGQLRGLTLATDRRSVLRAVVHGVGYELRRLLSDCGQLEEIDGLSVTGGLCRRGDILQCLADVLERPLRVYGEGSDSAAGAAMLGLAGIRGTTPWRHAAERAQMTVQPGEAPWHRDGYRRYLKSRAEVLQEW